MSMGCIGGARPTAVQWRGCRPAESNLICTQCARVCLCVRVCIYIGVGGLGPASGAAPACRAVQKTIAAFGGWTDGRGSELLPACSVRAPHTNSVPDRGPLPPYETTAPPRFATFYLTAYHGAENVTKNIRSWLPCLGLIFCVQPCVRSNLRTGQRKNVNPRPCAAFYSI